MKERAERDLLDAADRYSVGASRSSFRGLVDASYSLVREVSKGNTACQPLRFSTSDSGVALILPLLRNHQVELGLIPVCQHFKTEGLKKSLKFLPARQRFNKQIARHPELIDKSPPFGMADDEAPAWPKHSGCVPTGTRLVGDIAVHGVHENHVHAGWVEFEQGNVSSVGPDIWMLLADTPQHPFCQIAGGYNSSSHNEET